jgi:hypothetical protein
MTSSPENASLLAILNKQLQVVQDLSGILVASRTAFVTMDVEAIYQHVAIQTECCDDLRTLEEQRKKAWQVACCAANIDPGAASLRSLIARLDPEVGAKIREIVTKLVLAEGELRHLNRANTILIDGSRRTLTILGNLLASFAPTYANPINPRNSGEPAASVPLL